MIFLSHTAVDKPFVSDIAEALALQFGRENIFYDSWSIQARRGYY